MSRRGRLWLFLAGAAVVAALFTAACFDLPSFGGDRHPYGDRAVRAALRHHTSNAIASVNFDQRALDTLGEETILFSAVLGAVVLLRQTADERRCAPAPAASRPRVRRFALLMLPVALVVGLYVVAHGQLSPGGGFQGGVATATALHLLYLAADYRALERVRPLGPYEVGEAVGEATYLITGVAAVLAGAAFLANVLPYGTFATLSSGGTVPLLNAAVGMEVACGVVVLLAQFLDQAAEIEGAEDSGSDGNGPEGNGPQGASGRERA
ncbi:MnhB domain-containing protein [Streptomyces sp. ME19-01-6]|uniref:MnhB domain-containing protein n=1 Tax=Streptomyces sp. ME19-01-6 TaxID=3028686 RepID=UPI0029A10E65|nr:MnhB domain-containing protein [Streptomyces sp. ME19-01-6]MDX3229098.1 MnhB domain-containing protein [Streptomyces sp. ME19-01-6]